MLKAAHQEVYGLETTSACERFALCRYPEREEGAWPPASRARASQIGRCATRWHTRISQFGLAPLSVRESFVNIRASIHSIFILLALSISIGHSRRPAMPCIQVAVLVVMATTRRAVLSSCLVSATIPATRVHAAVKFDAAPAIGSPFEWTSLWRASDSYTASGEVSKQSGLALEEVAAIITDDLTKGKYLLTGNLSPSIFDDKCRFQDPNNAVNGLSAYRRALSFLFDAKESSLDNVAVTVSGPGTITAEYTASGVLKLPWRPRIKSWAGHVTYSVNRDGLIVSQVDVWNITRLDAIRQTFTPGQLF